MALRVTPSTDETPHRLGRFAFRVVLGSALMLATIPATAESPGRDQDEPASDWRQEVGFQAANDALLDWLDHSPAGSLAAATWRDAVAEARRSARLAEPLRRTVAVADERVASVLAESPAAPPAWLESLGDLAPSLRLAVAEQLYNDQRLDACLAWTAGLEASEVFSAALLHYLRAVSLRQTVDDEAASASLERLDALLASQQPDALGEARRWVVFAIRRESEQDPEDLPVIARMMRDVERRLEIGSPGEPTQERQQLVLDRLDELIKRLEEQQKQQQQQAAAGAGGGADPRSPAEDSRPSELKGPGEVDRKRLVAGDAWGSLPPAERERLTQEIARDYPAHYRGLIEDYFRTLAEEPEPEPETAP